MNAPRVRIGDLVDHEHRLWAFERNTRLPRNTFQRDPILPHMFAIVVSVGGFLLALFLGWVGQ